MCGINILWSETFIFITLFIRYYCYRYFIIIDLVEKTIRYSFLMLAWILLRNTNFNKTDPRPATHTDFISIYWFFNRKLLQNTDLFPLKLGEIQIFLLKCQRFFLILYLFIQIFFLKYWFSWSFILILCQIIVAGLRSCLETDFYCQRPNNKLLAR